MRKTLVLEQCDPAPLRVAAELWQGCAVEAVAQMAGWSTRHLRRLSADWFGYGPKHLQRVLRLRRAQVLLDQGMRKQWWLRIADTLTHHISGVIEWISLSSPDHNGQKRSTGFPSGSATVAYLWPQNASQGSWTDILPVLTSRLCISSTEAGVSHWKAKATACPPVGRVQPSCSF